MLFSIDGKITVINTKFIVVKNGGIGYEILVSKPETFSIGEDVSLFLDHVIKEDDEFLVGFRTIEEKNAFKLLLNVNGIGPKSANQILACVDYNDLLTAISNNDIEFLKSIPGLPTKTINQMILDLSDYIARSNKENRIQYKEVREALKSFKFKAKEIDKVLPHIYLPNATNEEILKEALRRLAKNVN